MKEFLRKHVLHNWGLKLVSLVLAAGLWLAVTREPVEEVAIDVPIEFHDIPQNIEISSETVPKAQIRLRGPQRLIRRLQPDDVNVEIDLSGVRPGERTFDLTSRQIHKPADLEVVQVVPSQFHIAFDTLFSRQVSVEPRVVGTFATGYEIGQVVVDPPVVTVAGPKKRVQAMESAVTEPVDISGTITRATFVRQAYVSDPLIQVTNPDPVRVTVTMEKAGNKQAAEPAKPE